MSSLLFAEDAWEQFLFINVKVIIVISNEMRKARILYSCLLCYNKVKKGEHK